MPSHQTATGITITSFTNTSDWVDLPFGLRQAHLNLGDAPTDPILMLTHFPPDRVLPRHDHSAPFCDAVVDGSMWVDDDEMWYERGAVRFIPGGTPYGPTKSGPDGLTLLEFYATAEGMPANMHWDVMAPEQMVEVEAYRMRRDV